MSALADQILTHLEQCAFDEDVRLDQIDEFIAAELGMPVAGRTPTCCCASPPNVTRSTGTAVSTRLPRKGNGPVAAAATPPRPNASMRR